MIDVIFCGPLGTGKIIGGGESGNRRTITILESLGLSILKIPKPYPFNKNIIGAALYLAQLIFYFFRFIYALIITINDNAKVHISGFYGHLIPIEYAFLLFSKIFRRKTTYELRAGGLEIYYWNLGAIYRFFFKRCVLLSDEILCQGTEYIDFLAREFDIEGKYYPNFIIADEFSDYNDFERPIFIDDEIKLIYFGRLTKSKNVEFLLEIAHILMCDNVKFNLALIGSGPSEYLSSIKETINKLSLQACVMIIGPLERKLIFESLSKKHFFLFPSNEKREGHSNALTEAMALGVVPIASTAGFNASVINNNDLIVNDFNPTLYAHKILTIWNSGNWKTISDSMKARVYQYYTDEYARKLFMEVYF